ncbi:MAG: hypothetical protein ACI8ZB_003807 [Desulforhopalus sp.]|jgi:hypothetical protein
MFKSIDCNTKQQIIIIDPYWTNETISDLRLKGRDNQLNCPVCNKPVHVKAGEKKRWHFAHKDLSDCPMKHESANILQARSLLYRWLYSKYGKQVTVEKHFPESDLPRPLDCYVEISENEKYGYWILENGLKARGDIQSTLFDLGISTTWVFLFNLLDRETDKQQSVHLSPTERELAYGSEYNQIYSQYNLSINYLHLEPPAVMTLRGLSCVHLPQKYEYTTELTDRLSEMLVSPLTGEIVHPGEHEKLVKHKNLIEAARLREEEVQRELEKRRQKQIEQRAARITENKPQREPNPIQTRPQRTEKKVEKEEAEEVGLTYLCRICGKSTTDWSTLFTEDNTCICSRECLRVHQGR